MFVRMLKYMRMQHKGEHMRTCAAVETSGQTERRGCVMMEVFQENFWKP